MATSFIQAAGDQSANSLGSKIAWPKLGLRHKAGSFNRGTGRPWISPALAPEGRLAEPSFWLHPTPTRVSIAISANSKTAGLKQSKFALGGKICSTDRRKRVSASSLLFWKHVPICADCVRNCGYHFSRIYRPERACSAAMVRTRIALSKPPWQVGPAVEAYFRIRRNVR